MITHPASNGSPTSKIARNANVRFTWSVYPDRSPLSPGETLGHHFLDARHAFDRRRLRDAVVSSAYNVVEPANVVRSVSIAVERAAEERTGPGELEPALWCELIEVGSIVAPDLTRVSASD